MKYIMRKLDVALILGAILGITFWASGRFSELKQEVESIKMGLVNIHATITEGTQ